MSNRGEDGGRGRELLRKIARQRNPIGFACSVLVWVRREGVDGAARRIRFFLGRNAAQRHFVRKLLHPDGKELERQRAHAFSRKVTISLLVPLYNTPETFLREMIGSVREQTYGGWELCLADGSDEAHPEVERVCRELSAEDSRIRYRKLERNGGISENTNACMEMATGEYIGLFDHDDLLLPSALYEVMRAIEEQGADFIYTDEMVFASPDRAKVIGMHLKPDYAPDDLLANNYICHLTVFRASLAEKAGRFRKAYDGSQDHDLILRLTDAAEKIVHIPKVLYLWRSHPASVAGDIGSKTYAVEAGRNAVRDFLRSKGIAAEVESSPIYPTLYRVRYPVTETPEITVITETPMAETERKEWIRRLRAATDYPALTDGEEAGPARTEKDDVLKDAGISGRLNALAARAGGDYLLFLEGGVTPEDAGWLKELLAYARREDVGCAGGQILDGNGRIREAGVVIGLGEKQHAAARGHYRAEGDSPGFFGQLAIVEDMSAVTGACMLIRKDVFREAGGFDEELRNALYDADLCLRLRERGRLIVCTPYARMRGGTTEEWIHELGSERDGYEADAGRFREKWREALAKGDPYYNENLTTELSDFRVKV